VEAGKGFTQQEKECWAAVRSHRLFSVERRRFDPMILDEVERRFPELALKAGDVIKLKSVIDEQIRGHPLMVWFQYWSIFVYATKSSIEDLKSRPRIFWLWDSACSQFSKIWIEDGH
jgi:hypothetical protein